MRTELVLELWGLLTSEINNGFVSLCRTAAENWDSVSSLLNFGLSSRRGRCLANDPCGFTSDAQVNPWSRLAAEEAPLSCICFLGARQRQPVFIPPSCEPERTGTDPDTRASVHFCAVPPFPSCRTSRGGRAGAAQPRGPAAFTGTGVRARGAAAGSGRTSTRAGKWVYFRFSFRSRGRRSDPAAGSPPHVHRAGGPPHRPTPLTEPPPGAALGAAGRQGARGAAAPPCARPSLTPRGGRRSPGGSSADRDAPSASSRHTR